MDAGETTDAVVLPDVSLDATETAVDATADSAEDAMDAFSDASFLDGDAADEAVDVCAFEPPYGEPGPQGVSPRATLPPIDAEAGVETCDGTPLTFPEAACGSQVTLLIRDGTELSGAPGVVQSLLEIYDREQLTIVWVLRDATLGDCADHEDALRSRFPLPDGTVGIDPGDAFTAATWFGPTTPAHMYKAFDRTGEVIGSLHTITPEAGALERVMEWVDRGLE
ncbi:MAG: hypothetical protein AAF411_16660 [Myxococcota bacterium]